MPRMHFSHMGRLNLISTLWGNFTVTSDDLVQFLRSFCNLRATCA